MNKMIICPTCKTNYEIQPETCTKCGFPFTGTEKEKSIFIGQQILKKGNVSDTKDRIKRARIILWIIGGLNILSPFLIYNNNPLQGIYIITGIIIGLIFIGFGFFTYKKPLISILIPLILLLLFYIIGAIAEPISLIQGIIWKVIFVSGLIYGLISIIKAEKIRKESEFLKEQNYK
ncbi:MAG: zinc-ribbon domain-containing protein [Bacteroidales bacterium]|nr:zinc-ribbon domain-containing protein [Bacteroidales bacterium]